jgi:hypothetical protein
LTTTYTVDVSDPAAFNDFVTGSQVVDDFLSSDTWTSYTVTKTSPTSDVITFYEGDWVLSKLTFNGVTQGDTLVVSPPKDNGGCDTVITAECVCFLAGTHIATPAGERLVQNLRAGDLVRTFSGAFASVKWVGQRTIDTAALRAPELAMPVRVTAGAIAEGVPQRDLCVTPEHALLVDGHLIPARLLVNGTTIRLDQVDSYTFDHVELDQHDILLAEGMGAESYLDTGNRGLFANSDVVDLFVQPSPTVLMDYNAGACMPLTLDPAATGAVWHAIAARAAALGQAASLPVMTHEPDLAVLAGGRRLRPALADRRRVAFALPAGTRTITLSSRATMPWSLHPWLDDRRRLGVAIDRILLRSADEVREIALDSPTLGAGWWDAETTGGRQFRWTDGAARIDLPVTAGPIMLEISLHATAAHAVVAANSSTPTPLPVALAG